MTEALKGNVAYCGYLTSKSHRKVTGIEIEAINAKGQLWMAATWEDGIVHAVRTALIDPRHNSLEEMLQGLADWRIAFNARHRP